MYYFQLRKIIACQKRFPNARRNNSDDKAVVGMTVWQTEQNPMTQFDRVRSRVFDSICFNAHFSVCVCVTVCLTQQFYGVVY